MGHEAGIFPENTARQIVALEVAGSNPVGHPKSSDAPEAEIAGSGAFCALDSSSRGERDPLRRASM
jgi:hypothetical protein